MTPEKQKIIDYAKKLYLKYDTDGNRINSFRAIEKKLLQKGYKKVTHTTIKRWSETYDWNGVHEKIKIHSIEKAKEKNFTKEEQIIDAKSNDLAEIYKQSMNVFRASSITIKKAFDKGELTAKEALQGMKQASDVIMRINDIPDPEKNKVTEIKLTYDDFGS